MRRSSSGFTMIELLVVIAVIGILAGLLLPVLGQMRERGRVAATMASVKNVEVGLRQYDFVFGQYPPDYSVAVVVLDPSYDLSAECLYYYLGTAFRKLPNTAKGEVLASKNGGPFFEFKHEYLSDTDGDGNMEFIDYWETPFEYDNIRDDEVGHSDCSTNGPDPRSGVAKNPHSYDLWSLGPDMGATAKSAVANFKP